MHWKLNLTRVICLRMGKTTEAKPHQVILKSPLLRIHYYQNKRLQVKESQYLIPTYSWTLTPITNWTCDVAAISPFNAWLPIAFTWQNHPHRRAQRPTVTNTQETHPKRQLHVPPRTNTGFNSPHTRYQGFSTPWLDYSHTHRHVSLVVRQSTKPKNLALIRPYKYSHVPPGSPTRVVAVTLLPCTE